MSNRYHWATVALLMTFGGQGWSAVFDCNISADGLFLTGEVIRGSASDIASVELVDWIHTDPSFTFEATAGDVTCNINGEINADLIGAGSGLLDGAPGFSYTIYIEDNRPPGGPDTARLCSTLVQSPRTRNEGSAYYDTPRWVTIPAALPVRVGFAGRGKARLELDNIKCSYRGEETIDYLFERCAGPGGVELMVGDALFVRETSLRIISADRAFPVTSVLVDIGDNPLAGEPDFYTIEIFDPSGGSVESLSGSNECGDIDIEPAP